MSRVIDVRHGPKRAVVLAGIRGPKRAVVLAGIRGPKGPVIADVGVDADGYLVVTLDDGTTVISAEPVNRPWGTIVGDIESQADLMQLLGDLEDSIPTTPSEIGAATADQGDLADSAVQPGDITDVVRDDDPRMTDARTPTGGAGGVLSGSYPNPGFAVDMATQQELESGLANKVDKVTGYGLSQENFTSGEKSKLAALEGSRWKGTFPDLGALQSAYPSAEPGDYADVDAESAQILRYIWDDTDSEWVPQAGESTPVTASQVKTLYESNVDTNAFDDAAKDKLSNVAAGATKNANTDELSEGTTNLYHTAARVRGVVLTGLSTAVTTAIAATDTVLQALGKLAGRLETAFDRDNHTGTQDMSTVSGLTSALEGKQATLVSATNIKTINGNSLLGAGDLAVGGGGESLPSPVIADPATARTLGLADAGAYLATSATTAVTLTVPPQADVSWAADTEIHIEQGAAGAVTIAAGTGVTLQHGASVVPTTREAHSPVTLKRKAEDVWVVFGALEAAE